MKKLLILLVIAYCPVLGQTKIKTIALSDTIIDASIDRPGDLYLLTKHGQFQKFDQDGKLLVLYKGDHAPTLFDPRDGARLFAYYRHIQHYDFLSPSFAITQSFRIDPEFVIQPWLICTSGDHKLWILDSADHSLKKLNPKEHEIEVEVIIDSTVISNATGFTRMREYQNFVFLLNPRKGIFVFNSLGQHIKTIEVHPLRNFHFLGQELYYAEGEKLVFFDLFTAQTREISLEGVTGDIIVTEQRLFAVHPTSVDIYEFKP